MPLNLQKSFNNLHSTINSSLKNINEQVSSYDVSITSKQKSLINLVANEMSKMEAQLKYAKMEMINILTSKNDSIESTDHLLLNKQLKYLKDNFESTHIICIKAEESVLQRKIRQLSMNLLENEQNYFLKTKPKFSQPPQIIPKGQNYANVQEQTSINIDQSLILSTERVSKNSFFSIYYEENIQMITFIKFQNYKVSSIFRLKSPIKNSFPNWKIVQHGKLYSLHDDSVHFTFYINKNSIRLIRKTKLSYPKDIINVSLHQKYSIQNNNIILLKMYSCEILQSFPVPESIDQDYCIDYNYRDHQLALFATDNVYLYELHPSGKIKKIISWRQIEEIDRYRICLFNYNSSCLSIVGYKPAKFRILLDSTYNDFIVFGEVGYCEMAEYIFLYVMDKDEIESDDNSEDDEDNEGDESDDNSEDDEDNVGDEDDDQGMLNQNKSNKCFAFVKLITEQKYVIIPTHKEYPEDLQFRAFLFMGKYLIDMKKNKIYSSIARYSKLFHIYQDFYHVKYDK